MIGTWFMTGSPQVMDILYHNLEFIIIDMEHGNIENNDLLNILNATGDMEYVWARPRTNTLPDIQQLIDAGVTGIILPHIETKEQVEQFIRYTKYPPDGELGYSPFTRGYCYHPSNATHPIDTAIIIESKKAVENIDSIVSVSELDMVYIGVYDLSKEYGFAIDSDEMTALFTHIALKTTGANKDLGAIYKDKKSKAFLESFNVNWMVYKTDTAIIFDATKDI